MAKESKSNGEKRSSPKAVNPESTTSGKAPVADEPVPRVRLKEGSHDDASSAFFSRAPSGQRLETYNAEVLRILNHLPENPPRPPRIKLGGRDYEYYGTSWAMGTALWMGKVGTRSIDFLLDLFDCCETASRVPGRDHESRFNSYVREVASMKPYNVRGVKLLLHAKAVDAMLDDRTKRRADCDSAVEREEHERAVARLLRWSLQLHEAWERYGVNGKFFSRNEDGTSQMLVPDPDYDD